MSGFHFDSNLPSPFFVTGQVVAATVLLAQLTVPVAFTTHTDAEKY